MSSMRSTGRAKYCTTFLLFTVISREDKYRAKNVIDTVGYRLGDFGASWLGKGLAAAAGSVAAWNGPWVTGGSVAGSKGSRAAAGSVAGPGSSADA